MGFHLVPVSNGVDIVRAKIRLPVFQRHFDGLMKTDWGFEMPAVHSGPATRFFLGVLHQPDDRGRVEWRETPGTIEVIFSAGTVNPRFLFAVDPDHVVAFVPCSPLVVEDRQHHANELTLTFCIQNNVVVFTGFVKPAWIFACSGEIVAVDVSVVPTLAGCALPVLRVEVGGLWERWKAA